jgi:hypothetical protein
VTVKTSSHRMHTVEPSYQSMAFTICTSLLSSAFTDIVLLPITSQVYILEIPYQSMTFTVSSSLISSGFSDIVLLHILAGGCALETSC